MKLEHMLAIIGLFFITRLHWYAVTVPLFRLGGSTDADIARMSAWHDTPGLVIGIGCLAAAAVMFAVRRLR